MLKFQEREEKRLRDLQGVAQEFLQLQRTYVQLLTNIAIHYPQFLRQSESYERRLAGKLLPTAEEAAKGHVVMRIAGQLEVCWWWVGELGRVDFKIPFFKFPNFKNPEISNPLTPKSTLTNHCQF